LQSLDLVEPLNWVSDALNRVDRVTFNERFSDGSAVQYFYEPFLAAFDPELRKQLGVWYTPQSVVRYMVERVHRTLIDALGLPDGLADERVVVLDPCCGTGAYLVEVIRRIHQTLQEQGGDALGATDLKSAVLGRLYGFELLTAPFVVAHLQLGLLLGSLGAPLKDSETRSDFSHQCADRLERAGRRPDKKSRCPKLRAERDAADKVKQEKKILVILGNPPYDGYAGIAMREERELSQAYRSTTNPQLPRPEGQGFERVVCAILPHGRTQNHAGHRRRHRVFHFLLQLARRQIAHGNARSVSVALLANPGLTTCTATAAFPNTHTDGRTSENYL
jgi:hypothetical protein